MLGLIASFLVMAQGASLVLAQSASLWAQCGGAGFTGQSLCPITATCQSYNPYYFQCIPARSTSTMTTTSSTTTSTASTISTTTTTTSGSSPSPCTTGCTSFRDCCSTVTQCKSYCGTAKPYFSTPPTRTCTCLDPLITGGTRCSATTSRCITYEGLPCCQSITETQCQKFCIGATPTPMAKEGFTCGCQPPTTTTPAPTASITSCPTTTKCTSYEGLPCCRGNTVSQCQTYCVGQSPKPFTTVRYICDCPRTTTTITRAFTTVLNRIMRY